MGVMVRPFPGVAIPGRAAPSDGLHGIRKAGFRPRPFRVV